MIGAKEIKMPFYCNPCTRNQFEVFNAGITYLHAGAVLAVLYNCIVQIQFVLCMRDDVVSPKAGEVKLAENSKLPIVIGLINQRRLGKNGLEAELVAKHPDNTTTRSDGRVLIKSPAQSNDCKNLVFL